MIIRDQFQKWDGHSHTHYCHHGERVAFSAYIEQAVSHGFSKYSLTEHPPLPTNWLADPEMMDLLAMPTEDIFPYIQEAKLVKEQYADIIQISVGLELDYLEGKEGFTKDILTYGDGHIEEAVVSVHFLRGKEGMRCVDFSANDWRDGLLRYYGSMDKVVDEYFDQVEAAIRFAGTLAIPTRIGHLLLIKKFAKELPAFDEEQIHSRLKRILPLLKTAHVGIDANMSGLRVKTCQEAYVPFMFLHEANSLGIEVVYGSDAHRPNDVGSHWDWFEKAMKGGVHVAGR